MNNYYAYAYVVDGNLETVKYLGVYTISIQGYTGTTYSGRDENVWKQKLIDGLENYSLFGGTIITTDAFNKEPYLAWYPVIDVIKLDTDITDSTYRIKLLFPDNGDYLIGNTINTSSAGYTFDAYDRIGNRIGTSLNIPGAVNSLTNPSYTDNFPQYRFVPASAITNDGFITNPSISDYYVYASILTSYKYIYSRQNNDTYVFLNRHIPNVPIGPTGGNDPYADGGTSEPGGGGGSFDDSTDVITTPEYDPVDLLNRSYGNRGFVHVYLPTQAELTTLHAFMWDNSLVTDMQKMFGNVADAVISLNLIPLDFTDATPNRGNILMGLIDSQIETTIAKQQFVTLDCGTIEIGEFFASYLDYSPYSKLQIYLPYIGVKDLDIDEFMNAYISVKYVIDIVSGDCVAFISKSGAIDNAVVKDNPILGVLYQFAGNCALNVPISGSNYAQMHAADIGALISGAGVLGNFLTGGMSAPSAVTGILSTAANVVTSKPSVSRGGAVSSTVGYMSIQKPYLILTRPRMCLPEDQNTFTGYPAYVTMTPGDTSGYTEFEIIHLENIPATDAEKNELETLLKTGVIL